MSWKYFLSIVVVSTIHISCAHAAGSYMAPPIVNNDKELHDALDALERQHNTIAKTLRAHDIEIRKNCLLIWGIPGKTYDTALLIDEVLQLFNSVLHVPTKAEEIDFCFRSREESDQRDKDTIPLLVRFTTFNKKKKILCHAQEMFTENDTYTVDNYLNHDDIMMIESEPYYRY